jgi:beta-1,4-mannosyl-glycoprotein beta-1,4-N-acetylglucosaminyltransferase
LFDIKKFENFKDKIIYLKIEKFPDNIGIWERQDYQRNYLLRGLKNINKKDVVIYSDADEIINPKLIAKFADIKNNVVICNQYCFYYKLNLLSDQYKKTWQGSRIVKFEFLKSFSWLRSIDKKNLKYSFFRFDKFKRIQIFEDGGWHFSYLMSEKEIQKKIKAWTHSELDTAENNNLETIKDRVRSNKDLFGRNITLTKIEFTKDHFPEHIVKNKEQYKNWII